MKKTFYLFLVIIMSVMLNNCSISTANIGNIKVCDNVTDNQCTSDNPLFSTNTELIYVSGLLKNAPEGTQVTFSWYYNGDEKVMIDEVSLTTQGDGSTFPIQSSLSKPLNGWPAGDYEVIIKLNTDNSEPITKTFTVE